MPAAEDKKPLTPAISPDEGVDVAALFARLQEELRRPPTGTNGATPGAARSALRAQAERLWPVTAERPYLRRPGFKGLVTRPVKPLLAPLLRWYVEPLAADQRAFNDALLKLVDELSERTDEALAARESAERRAQELDERLLRLERRGPSAAPATVAAQPAAAALPDYFAFESRLRGSTGEVRERQRAYVEDFRDAAPVLDAGCGRGEFLVLLREAGVEARGIDADADMVAFARGEGVEVEQADVLVHLEALPERRLGGIFAAQVVEHLPPAALLRFLELVVAKLRPGGLLVAETINPLSPLALRNYFADLTHAQPLVPQTMELLVRGAGFAHVELRFLNAPEPAPGTDDRVNEIVFAPLDYAVVARTAKP